MGNLMTSKISPMKKSDLKTIIKMGENTPEFQTGTDCPSFYQEKTLQGWIKDPNGLCFVAKVNGKVVGFSLGYCMMGPKDAYLNCVVVEPSYRRKGIGRGLLRARIKKAKQRGCNHVFCVVKNKKTIQFLQKEGLQKGETFNYMEKLI